MQIKHTPHKIKCGLTLSTGIQNRPASTNSMYRLGIITGWVMVQGLKKGRPLLELIWSKRKKAKRLYLTTDTLLGGGSTFLHSISAYRCLAHPSSEQKMDKGNGVGTLDQNVLPSREKMVDNQWRASKCLTIDSPKEEENKSPDLKHLPISVI